MLARGMLEATATPLASQRTETQPKQRQLVRDCCNPVRCLEECSAGTQLFALKHSDGLCARRREKTSRQMSGGVQRGNTAVRAKTF